MQLINRVVPLDNDYCDQLAENATDEPINTINSSSMQSINSLMPSINYNFKNISNNTKTAKKDKRNPKVA